MGAPDGDPAGAGPWYVDKSSGRRRIFRPSPDEAVVSFSPTAGEDPQAQLTSVPGVRSVSRGVHHRRGVAAVWVDPDAPDRATLAGVDAVLPVMVDDEGLSRYFVPGEVTVQFHDDVPASRAEELIDAHAGTVAVRQRTPGYYTVRLADGRDVFATIRQLTDLPEVAFAEPSEIGFDDALRRHLPDDPLFDQQWGLRNTGQVIEGEQGEAGADIDATRAWTLHRGDPDVIVAVIDTGADLDHPDLEPTLLDRGGEDWNFADDDDPVPGPGYHGTHVSGIASAAENAYGIVGVAPRCRLMPLHVDLLVGFNQNRADAINYTTDQADAHPHRRYVVNCSWRTSGDHAGVRRAIERAVRHGLVVVFAAGNANRDIDETPQYPASYPQAIAVAAINNRNEKANFSNFGGDVDLSAPGEDILSTVPDAGDPDDAHAYESGTSMAAPHVAGVAALLWSAVPGLTNQEVRRILVETCDDLHADNPDFVNQLGGGRVNAHRALEHAQFYGGYVPLLAPALAEV